MKNSVLAIVIVSMTFTMQADAQISMSRIAGDYRCLRVNENPPRDLKTFADYRLTLRSDGSFQARGIVKGVKIANWKTGKDMRTATFEAKGNWRLIRARPGVLAVKAEGSGRHQWKYRGKSESGTSNHITYGEVTYTPTRPKVVVLAWNHTTPDGTKTQSACSKGLGG